MNAGNWIRPVVLAASCLVIGFVGGWSIANLGGDTVALPSAKVDVTVETPTPATNTVTETAEQAPERGTVAVTILNATSTAGLAARMKTQLAGLGYTKVGVDSVTGQSGATTVYFREGARPAAEQLAKDLRAASVKPIAGTPLATAAPAASQVVAVLLSGG